MQIEDLQNGRYLSDMEARLIRAGVNFSRAGPSANTVRSGEFPLELELEPLILDHVPSEYSKEGPLRARITFQNTTYDLGVCDHIRAAYDKLAFFVRETGELPSGVIVKSSVLYGSERKEITALLTSGRITDQVAFTTERRGIIIP